MEATWVPCGGCSDWYCRVHKRHAHECSCPPAEEWTHSPYGNLNDSGGLDKPKRLGYNTLMMNGKRLTIATLRAAARVAGAVLDDQSSGDDVVIYVDLPLGKRWLCDDSLTMLCVQWGRDGSGRTEAIADALERIAEGVRDATADELAADRYAQDA